MGAGILQAAVWVVALLGIAGIALEVVSLVVGKGRRLAIAGLVLRALGIVALAAFVVAGRGRPDFQDLVFVLYGMLSAVALWLAALVTDAVLLFRRRRRP